MNGLYSLTELAGICLLAMPFIPWIASLPPAPVGRSAALTTRKRVRGALFTSLFLALLADIAFALGARSSLELAVIPLPVLGFGLPISVAVNPLTLVLATLVAFVASIIAQYSINYLDGDPCQARFFRLLASTVAGFMTAVIAGNIGLFTLAIIVTGFSLQRLLKFYPERPKAVMAAHKNALFSRTADLCLLAATYLLGKNVGTLQFDAIARYVMHHQAALPLQVQLAAWLIVGAVIFKSAHFPFHGWLIQVMEAPTPVSALMHAGIVYSGAILALRCAELLSNVPQALIFLGLVGLLSVLIASLVMTTQTAVKSALAWSTAAQLGFMSLELGLGLFPLALLHLLGHSLYKAHAFLSAGSVTDRVRQVPAGGIKQITHARWATTVVLGGIIAFGMAAAFAYDPFYETQWIALGVILALAITQILLKGLSFPGWQERFASIVLAAGISGVYLGLHTLFVREFFLISVDSGAHLLTGAAYIVLIAATAIGFLLLSWLQGPALKTLPPHLRLALYTHLYNGLYIDQWVERFSHRLWSEKLGVTRPRKHFLAGSGKAAESREWITE